MAPTTRPLPSSGTLLRPTPSQSCGFVGLTASSAYALRRRAAGAAFGLGWQAAVLLARDTFADPHAARDAWFAGLQEAVASAERGPEERADGSDVSSL